MKSIPIITVLLVVLLSGCNKREEEVAQLNQENQLLSDSLGRQEETINSLVQAIGQIENNVRAITSPSQAAEDIQLEKTSVKML